jgi:hypothetical protein
MVGYKRASVQKTLVALPVGALIASTLVSAPTANANCASFFSLGSSPSCTSTPTSIAVAIGTNAIAHADGLFGVAFAVGTNSFASTTDALDTAVVLGNHSTADALGVVGLAIQVGDQGFVMTLPPPSSPGGLGLNAAISISPSNTATGGSVVEALGTGNLALNLLGSGDVPTHVVLAKGQGNIATNFLGNNNVVSADGQFNNAFAALGNHNGVTASPGPLAIAGSILQTGTTIIRQGPGFNINGFRVGGAAATPPAAHIKPAAAGVGNPKSR